MYLSWGKKTSTRKYRQPSVLASRILGILSFDLVCSKEEFYSIFSCVKKPCKLAEEGNNKD